MAEAGEQSNLCLFRDMWEQALPLILHHSSISKIKQQVCRLLCVSKAVAATVAKQLAGKVSVQYGARTLPQAIQFGSWLQKRACMLHTLELNLPANSAFNVESDSDDDDGEDRWQAGDSIAAALQQAPGLQLQRFSTSTPSATILAQLPSSTLTRLDLQGFDFCAPARIQAVAAALAGLTALRSLSLPLSLSYNIVVDSELVDLDNVDAVQHVTFGDILLPALASLTQLTALRLTNLAEEGLNWQHLPAQLVKLRLKVDEEDIQYGPLLLGHLTALTELYIGTANNDKQRGHVVADGDVLPPNLPRLAVGDCRSVRPLLQVQQLQQLHVMDSTVPAHELRQLTSLTQLSSVELWYQRNVAAVAASAAAWDALPIQHLELNMNCADDGIIPAAAVQQLGRIQGLTRLDLWHCNASATPQQCAAALWQLTGLQELQLGRLTMQQDEAGSAAGSEVLIPAIAGLPRLRSLWLSFQPLGASAALLGSATNLTCLTLEGGDIQDNAVVAIAHGLKGLSVLKLHYNRGVTDAALPAIAELSQLTSLDLWETGITYTGAQSLSCMTQLMYVRLGTTRDPNAPKKPVSAFIWHCNDVREGVKAAHPEWGAAHIGGELATLWAQLSEEQRIPYQQQEAQDRQRYEQDMQSYVPPGGHDGGDGWVLHFSV